MDVAPENRRLLDFHAVLGADLSRDLPADDHGTGLNTSLNTCALSDDEGVRGVNLTPKSPANTHRPKEAQLSLELTAGLNDPGDC